MGHFVWGVVLVAVLIATPLASAAAPGVNVRYEVDSVATVTVDSDAVTSGDGNALDHVVLKTALRDDGIAVGDVADVAVETPEWFTEPVVHAGAATGRDAADAVDDPLQAPRATAGGSLRIVIDLGIGELSWTKAWATTAHDRLTPIVDRFVGYVLSEAGIPTCAPVDADVCWSNPASRPRVAFPARNATLATGADAWEAVAAEGHEASHDVEHLTPVTDHPVGAPVVEGVHTLEANTGAAGGATTVALREGADEPVAAHDATVKDYKATRDDLRGIIMISHGGMSTPTTDGQLPKPAPAEEPTAMSVAPATTPAPAPHTEPTKRASTTEPEDLNEARLGVAGHGWTTASGGDASADGGHDARTTYTFGAAGMAVTVIFGLFSRLYTRIRDALAHHGRARLMEILRATPGIGASALADRAGMTRSTVRYHLGRLVADGHVVARKFGGWPVYHVNGAPSARDDSAAGAALAHPVTARVHAALEDEPERSVRDLARRVGLSVGGAHHHVEKLRAAGLVPTA